MSSGMSIQGLGYGKVNVYVSICGKLSKGILVEKGLGAQGANNNL